MVSRAFLEADLDMKTNDNCGLALKLKHAEVEEADSCHPAGTCPGVAAMVTTVKALW